jgi:hypothetical protein
MKTLPRLVCCLACFAAALLLAPQGLKAEPAQQSAAKPAAAPAAVAQPDLAAVPQPAPTTVPASPAPKLCSFAAPIARSLSLTETPAPALLRPQQAQRLTTPGCVTVDDCEDMCFGDCPWGCTSICVNLAQCMCSCRCPR